MIDQSIYQQNGYESRNDYLRSLAEEYGVPLHVVRLAATMLGPNEDFDGLVTELQDYAETYEED
jgi:hypothetical protein